MDDAVALRTPLVGRAHDIHDNERRDAGGAL
jgi:hypothetical protein